MQFWYSMHQIQFQPTYTEKILVFEESLTLFKSEKFKNKKMLRFYKELSKETYSLDGKCFFKNCFNFQFYRIVRVPFKLVLTVNQYPILLSFHQNTFYLVRNDCGQFTPKQVRHRKPHHDLGNNFIPQKNLTIRVTHPQDNSFPSHFTHRTTLVNKKY